MSELRASRREARSDAARLLHAAARERVAVALADLFVPQSLGLSEQHRTSMGALLARLVRSVEDDLRTNLATRFDATRYPAINAALTSVRVELVLPILASSDALKDPELITLLLRRVEEHRLYLTAQARPGKEGRELLAELVRSRDEIVARSAMVLLIAQSRRLDRFREPVIASPELPAEIEHRLVWTVAAALRVYLITRQHIEPVEADAALSAAAAARLASYDEGDGLEARSMQLAQRLDSRGRLDNALMVRALEEGLLPLFLAMIAVRCRMSLDAAWEILSDPRGNGAAFLLKAADLPREQAGTMLLALAHGVPGANPDDLLVRQMEAFDTMSHDEARDAISLWTVDAAYRTAVGRVSSRRSRSAAL
jgi:hypothetical protein